MEQSARKKVLVSGCFDLLHSGHVEFFCQAAQHGDLYVRLGTDANIKALKNHEPMYSEAERLFMVKNISCVHDAELSIGSGRHDYWSDMEVLQPDIYFVNEDASAMEEREAHCNKVGVQMIVSKRTAHDGLAARSSTSMKARLRENAAREDASKDLDDVRAYDRVVPWRLCFAGGWCDLKW